MEVKIREGVEKDYRAILSLVKELATFERSPDKVTNSVECMKEEKQYFQSIVAESTNGEIVGMAVFFFAYYTWVGKSLYVDDIYVKKSCRGKKIGTKLLKEVFKVAKKENCKRVRWQVLNWNKSAIDFYKKCGATIDDGWLNCDFDEKDIQEFDI